MKWWGKYVGTPFTDGGRDAAGLDCWGLVRLAFKEQRDTDLPSYGEISIKDLLRVAGAFAGGQERWEAVATPQAFDVAAMRFYARGWVGHVGLMIDGARMIHTEAAIDVSVVPVDHYTVKHRIQGFYRYRP